MLADAGVKIVREDRSYPEIQADRLEKVVRFAATVLDDQIRGDYLIDDSGLFLDAFGGFPGVYSSFVHKRLGNPGLLKLLQDAKTRAATFETVFLLRQGGSHEVFHGECRGTIAAGERGTGGFGFDPIFVPEGAPRAARGRRAGSRRLGLRPYLRPGGSGEDRRGDDGDGEEPRSPSGAGGGPPPPPPPCPEATLITLCEFDRKHTSKLPSPD